MIIVSVWWRRIQCKCRSLSCHLIMARQHVLLRILRHQWWTRYSHRTKSYQQIRFWKNQARAFGQSSSRTTSSNISQQSTIKSTSMTPSTRTSTSSCHLRLRHQSSCLSPKPQPSLPRPLQHLPCLILRVLALRICSKWALMRRTRKTACLGRTISSWECGWSRERMEKSVPVIEVLAAAKAQRAGRATEVTATRAARRGGRIGRGPAVSETQRSRLAPRVAASSWVTTELKSILSNKITVLKRSDSTKKAARCLSPSKSTPSSKTWRISSARATQTTLIRTWGFRSNTRALSKYSCKSWSPQVNLKTTKPASSTSPRISKQSQMRWHSKIILPSLSICTPARRSSSPSRAASRSPRSKLHSAKANQ